MSVTFSIPMLERLRQSLALRLAVQYALVFAASTVVLFGVLYWVLARALEQRDQAVVEQRAAILARAYEGGSLKGVVGQLNNDTAQDGTAWFARVIDPRTGPVWVNVALRLGANRRAAYPNSGMGGHR